MKKIFFTIAALLVMSASVFAKGEPSKDPGAPTGYPDAKKVTPIKVTYDDADAQARAVIDPTTLAAQVKVGDTTTMWFRQNVEAERHQHRHYIEHMGGESNTHALNLNYGSNAVLPPLHGSIR